MKTMLCIITLSLTLGMSAGQVVYAQADGPQGIQPAKPQGDKILKNEVRGELLKIDGDLYVVKEANGKEVKVQVDKETRIEPSLKPGDRVEVKVMPQGNIWSIKKEGVAN